MRTILRITFLAAVGASLLACPGPQPKPDPPPAPAGFVCDGAASVPNFDTVTNELVLAAQVTDDEQALAALDKVAIKRGGVEVVRCAIDQILPDLRAAPVTGVHLEAWEGRDASSPAATTDGGAQ